MKRVVAFLLIFGTFCFCCGFTFKREKPLLLLSSAPTIEQDTAFKTENIFKSGQRISFLFNYPKGFGDNVLRMTIYKLNDKTNTLGFETVRNRHISVITGDKYYSDYFVIYQSGIYQVQITELRKPQRILAFARFKVV